MNNVLKQIIDRLYPGSRKDLQSQLLPLSTGLTVIFTPNPEQCVLAQQSDLFRETLLKGDILLADGIGLVLAARRAGRKVERITGTDTLEWWLDISREKKTSTLLLGGRSDVAAQLARQYDPAGEWCHGLVGHLNLAAQTETIRLEETEIFDFIAKYRPRAIFVAFGAPLQEEWVTRNRKKLAEAGVSLVMVCGGAFDYLTGQVPRAPKWLQLAGFEWLFRLVKEPWRWRRQIRLLSFFRLAI